MSIDLDPAVLIACTGLFLIGGIVKGAIGFGLPLVTISVMPFFLPVEEALAINSVVLMATNLLQVWRAGHIPVALRKAAPILAAAAVATPLGVWLATLVPPSLLLGILGAFVVTFAMLSITTFEPRLPENRINSVFAGMIGGIVGSFTSAPGPIFVMYLVNLQLPRPQYMAMLGILMGAIGLFLTSSFLVNGVLNFQRIVLGAILVVPGLVGFVIGDRLARRLGDDLFRKLVLGTLIVLGGAHDQAKLWLRLMRGRQGNLNRVRRRQCPISASEG